MADSALDFLNDRHPIYVTHEAAWARDERRLVGGDAVIGYGAPGALGTTRYSTTRTSGPNGATLSPELSRMKGETDEEYARRQNEAEYLTLPERHASILAGHLRRVAPKTPNFGTLGEIRQRSEINGQPTLAELLYYNADGVGNDGSQYPAFCDGVQVRACATGVRWTLVEMPPLPAGRSPDAPITNADRRAGYRPYFVEFSPLQVPIWEMDRGRLDWAVARVPVGRSALINGVWTRANPDPGYYLFVRQGYDGLGDRFAGGGWWLFDADQKPVTRGVRDVRADDGTVTRTAVEAHGTWARTKGEIPMLPLLADDTPGTTERPALGRSLTMELGQIAVGLMNRVSERDYNARQAAKSAIYILGADPKNVDAFNLTAQMHESGAVIIPVVAYEAPDGDGHSKWIVPQIYNSASGAVETGVYQTIIDSKLATAREIMVRQVSAGLDVSGVSREAAFGEATSPLLARMAQRREGWENGLIYFAELRAGAAMPTGSVTYPTEFDLAPVVDDIDATLNTLRLSGLRSPTLEAKLVVTAADERGQLDDPAPDFRERVEAELAASAQAPQTSALETLLGGGSNSSRDTTPTPEPPAPPAPADPTPTAFTLERDAGGAVTRIVRA